MVSLAYGTPVNFKEIYTEGITGLTPLDIAYAKEFGFTIKLLAIAKYSDGEIEARVHPTMVPSASQIAKVDGVYNAIQLVGDAVEDVVLYGRGAGSMPTGSAVVSDVMAIARNLLKDAAGRVPPASYQPDQRRPLRMRPMEEITSLYYIRFMVLDRPGVLSQIAGVLDWEMATLGDPLMDLGNSLAYWVQADDDPIFQLMRRQPTNAPGMMTRDEVVAYYGEKTGWKVENFDFYLVYGLFRLAGIVQQIWYRYFHQQTTNPAFAQFGTMVNYLEKRCQKLIAASAL